MKMLSLVLGLMLSITAHAGFEGLNQDISLKVFSRLNCSTGLSCTKVKNKFTIAQNLASNIVGTGAGYISGYLNHQVTATATTITAAQCGSTFVNAGAIEIELPEASAVIGCKLTFIVGNASAFTIDPDAADIIVIATDAAGDKLVADAIGESIVIQAISASQWAYVGAPYGTWTDSN